jgi:hypothetical protein
MTGLLIVVGLMVLALIAPRYGVDLRDGRDWRSRPGQSVAGPRVRHTPRSDLAKLNRWAGWVGSVLGRGWEAQERAWGAAWQTYQPWRGDDRPPRLDVAPARVRHEESPGGGPGGGLGGGELGAGERGRHRGQLRWRRHRGSWRLVGRHLPASPSTGGPASEHPAHCD